MRNYSALYGTIYGTIRGVYKLSANRVQQCTLTLAGATFSRLPKTQTHLRCCTSCEAAQL